MRRNSLGYGVKLIGYLMVFFRLMRTMLLMKYLGILLLIRKMDIFMLSTMS